MYMYIHLSGVPYMCVQEFVVKITCKYFVTYTHSEYAEPQNSTSHNTNMLTSILLSCQKTASKHLQLPGSHRCLILNLNSPRSTTSPHLSDEQIPIHTCMSYTPKTYPIFRSSAPRASPHILQPRNLDNNNGSTIPGAPPSHAAGASLMLGVLGWD